MSQRERTRWRVEIKGLQLGTNKEMRRERAEMRLFIGLCPQVSPGTMTRAQMQVDGWLSDSSQDRNGEGSRLLVSWISEPRNGQIRKPDTEKT